MSGDLPDIEQKHYMSWLELGLILFGFSSPSGAVGVAYSIGTCGLVLGPIVAVIVTFATCCGALMFNEMIASLEDCEAQLEVLGGALLGESGRIWGRVIQQGNFIMYLPVAMLICAEAFRGFAEPSGETCVDYVILGISGGCFALTQVRRLSGRAASILSYISLVCVAVIVISLIMIVMDNEVDGQQRARAAGNPDMFSSRAILERRGYAKFCLGASTTAWAYVPTFLTVELTRALERPRADFEKALWFSAVLNLIVFFIVGLTVVKKWGWDVTDPVMATEGIWPEHSTNSRVLYFAWFVATAISYAFSSVALVDACQKRWLPGANFDTDWSAKSFIAWSLIALPTFLLALLLAIVVPSLFAMLTVATAFTVPWVNHVYPAVLYYKFVRRDSQKRCDVGDFYLLESDPDVDSKTDEIARRSNVKTSIISYVHPDLLVTFTLFVGLLVFLACAFGAAVKLSDHELRGPMAIGCPSWYLFEDDLAN